MVCYDAGKLVWIERRSSFGPWFLLIPEDGQVMAELDPFVDNLTYILAAGRQHSAYIAALKTQA